MVVLLNLICTLEELASNLQLFVWQANGVDERVDQDLRLQGDERDVVEEGAGVELMMQVDPLHLKFNTRPLCPVLHP